MAAPPPVTVGLPVRNGARFLPETLESLLGQTFGDFELVVSDNGSTDRTAEICRETAAKDPRVRYLRRDRDEGAARNYNRVFEEARGRYFRWNAADDTCAPDALAKCVARLDADPGAVLAYPATKIMDEDSRVKGDYPERLDVASDDPVARFRAVLELIGECNAVFGLVRADALRRTGLIGRFIGADVALLAELALHGRFARLDDTVFFRREHAAASSSRRTTEEQLLFYDPRRRRRVHLRTWRHHWEQLKAISRAPLRARDRLRAAGVVFRRTVTRRGVLAGELWSALRGRA